MGIELEFRAEDSDHGADDLSSLFRHLRDFQEKKPEVQVSSRREPARQGELGDVEMVLAVVATAAAVGDLALSVQAWVASLRRPPSVRLDVAEEHEEDARQVFEALRSSGAAANAVSTPGRIDPGKSACVLIGVDQYHDKDLESLRSVYNNVTQLREVLTDKSIFGIEDGRLREVRNPETAADLIKPIRQMADLATDTLIVYYSGHGLKELDDEELYLTLPGSVPGEKETSVPYHQQVMSAIRQTRRAKRLVIILDCCYSGKALVGGMSAAEGIQAAASLSDDDEPGSYLMTSAASDRKALAPNPDGCTVFTGELVDVLRKGLPDDRSEMLGLDKLYRELRSRLRNTATRPQAQDRNQVGKLEFVRNRARMKAASPAAPAEGRRSRAARMTLVAASIVLAFLGGLAVRPGLEWWRGRTPVPAAGACSSRATLLSHSDLLDKAQVKGEKVVGLSALALTGPASALALTDNAPARVFPLSLGRAEDLSPEAKTGLTLRHADGSQYENGKIDGEGLVIENGTRTILVSSEIEPSIRRFSLDTGFEVGEPLPIPEMLRIRPAGDAQAGRTIEALAATPDGRYLYAGWEAPLSIDGDKRGRNVIRIQRYQGSPGGKYVPDRQYAYQTGEGLHLVELVVIGNDRLLSLERQFVRGLGNAVQVHEVSLAKARDVSEDALYEPAADVFVESELLFDLAECPAGSPGQVAVRETQPNPLLGNVEGMAVTSPRQGSRLLYLVTDDNDNPAQITRLYAFRIAVP